MIVKSHSVAVVVALAVMSHWLLDVIVHTPDMPLWNDASPKLGLGLWNNAIATYALEAALLLAGLWVYLKSTSASTRAGKYGTSIFVAALLLVNVANIFGPLQGDSTVVFAVTVLASYFLFAAAAFWLDAKRS